MKDGDSEPLPTLAGFDLVPILQTVLLKLNIIQNDENVAIQQLMEKTKIRQKLRLMNGNNFHGCHQKLPII
jgi:hypothetical protein